MLNKNIVRLFKNDSTITDDILESNNFQLHNIAYHQLLENKNVVSLVDSQLDYQIITSHFFLTEIHMHIYTMKHLVKELNREIDTQQLIIDKSMNL